jgi:hypothetical protein
MALEVLKGKNKKMNLKTRKEDFDYFSILQSLKKLLFRKLID